MGRRLRSGRQIKSLSPPNKDPVAGGRGGRARGKAKPAPRKRKASPKAEESVDDKRSSGDDSSDGAESDNDDSGGDAEASDPPTKSKKSVGQDSTSDGEEAEGDGGSGESSQEDRSEGEGSSGDTDSDDGGKATEKGDPRTEPETPAKREGGTGDKDSSEDEEEEMKAPVPPENSDDEKDESSGDDDNEVEKAAPARPKAIAKVGEPKKRAAPKEEDSSEEDSSSGTDDDDSDGDDGDDGVKRGDNPKSKTVTEEDDSSSENDSSDEDDSNEEPPKGTTRNSKKDDSNDDGPSSSSDDDEKNPGFTDENSDWLKPKQTKQALLSSDEEQESDNTDDDGDLLEVERQSRILDAEMEVEREEAEAELQRTIAQQTATFRLPTPAELVEEEERVVPPSELRARVEDVLEVLSEFKVRREPGRSRADYLARLATDLSELFGYLQELVDYFLAMFGPAECLEFLEASDRPRPLVVRVNTLRARRKDLAAALIKRGVRLDPLAPWSKVGLKIHESAVPVGATPEYLAGHYMLQSAASMCPVMALGPQPGDRVLDVSAAPGGKTSYIAQLMRNKGVVLANDLKLERQKATVANLHRLGVRNVVTCCYDGRQIGGRLLRNSFDRILLDAPCSGLGVISRDPSVKIQRTMLDVQRCAHLQKELLVAAIDALNHKSKKGGGCMVYSTCSVAVAENEEVVNYLLSKRDVKLVDTGLDFGKPGFTRFGHKRFHPSVALTRRFYPHVHNMDGFYVAKIQKLSDKRRSEEDKQRAEREAAAAAADSAKKDNTDNGRTGQRANKQKAPRGKKKRGKAAESGDGGDDEGDVARKKPKIAQKKKTNAKVTKPRRIKMTGM